MTHSSFSRRSAGAISLLGAALLGCHNLDSFDSKPGESYYGTVGSPDFQSGFIQEGSPPSLELALRLDTSKLSSEPGMLRSREGQTSSALGLCGEQQLFANVALRAIPEVERDSLSALTFGEGHDHDFFAWVDSTCEGTMLSIVSLLKNDQVELRLFKPARRPAPDTPSSARPGFAVFHLDARKESDIGF
jgi:hypothetical protein